MGVNCFDTNKVLQQFGIIKISGKRGQKNEILLYPFLNTSSPLFRPLLLSYIPGAKFNPPVTFLVQLHPETPGTQVMSETRLDQKEMCAGSVCVYRYVTQVTFRWSFLKHELIQSACMINLTFKLVLKCSTCVYRGLSIIAERKQISLLLAYG